jgi:HK97 family phage portal protein
MFEFLFNNKKKDVKSCSSGQTLVLGANSSGLSFLLGNTQLTPSAAVDLYNSTTAVSVPINWISEAFAGLDIELVRKSRDGKEVIVSHPILDFINNPNRNQTSYEFKMGLCAMYLICGETEVALTGNVNNPPKSMYNIYPNLVSVLQDTDGFPASFLVSNQLLTGNYTRDERGNDDKYYRDSLTQIHQIKMFSTFNNGQLRGQSPLVSALTEVKQNISGIVSNLSAISNGGNVNLVFKLKDGVNLDNEEFQDVKENILAQYSGSTSKRVAVLNEDMDVSSLSMSNTDMQYVELHKMSTEAVAKQYKFPLPLVNSDSSTYNNIQSAYESFYDYAVFPVAKAILESLTILLMPRFGLDPNEYQLSYSDDISALETRKATLLEKRRKAYVETDNELRGIVGKPPTEDGDRVFRAANLVTESDVDAEL